MEDALRIPDQRERPPKLPRSSARPPDRLLLPSIGIEDPEHLQPIIEEGDSIRVQECRGLDPTDRCCVGGLIRRCGHPRGIEKESGTEQREI
jgi:hypothetical protein